MGLFRILWALTPFGMIQNIMSLTSEHNHAMKEQRRPITVTLVEAQTLRVAGETRPLIIDLEASQDINSQFENRMAARWLNETQGTNFNTSKISGRPS